MVNCDYLSDKRCRWCGDERHRPTLRQCPVATQKQLEGRLVVTGPVAMVEVTDGPGSRLKSWLAGHGLPSCQRCNALAAEMDRKGDDWCRENVDYLVDRIEKNVAAMDVITAKVLAIKLVSRRIRRWAIKKAIVDHALES